MHRMVWSFILLVPVVALSRHRKEFLDLLSDRKTLAILACTTVIVAFNWFLFIWAINNDQILQTSLGYYIAPLINILLGMIFLKEKLTRLQAIALCIAFSGVAFLAYRFGKFPAIALALALSFGFYGLIRKIAPVGAIVGLFYELTFLFLPAAAYLYHLDSRGTGAFLRMGVETDLLLAGCALVTGLPLLLFTVGAKRLRLTTIGFLQYIAPTGTFMLAVFYYKEPLVHSQLIAFLFIWTALIIYSIDSVISLKSSSRPICEKTPLGDPASR